MKNRTLLCILLTVGFVGATSCGNDDSKSAGLEAENAALRAALMNRNNGGNTNVTQTIVSTTVANVTLTAVSANVNAAVSSSSVTVTATNTDMVNQNAAEKK